MFKTTRISKLMYALAITCLGIASFTTSSADAQSRPAGLPPYTAFSPDIAKRMPPGGGWNNADPQTVQPGEEVWIAFENFDWDNATKTYRLELTLTDDSPGRFGQFHLKERVGFNGATATGAIPSTQGYWFFGSHKIIIDAGFPECVLWERFKFKNNGDKAVKFNMWFVCECSCKGDGDSDNDGVPDIFQIEPGTLGVPGGMNGPTQITEFHVYPQNAFVDMNEIPTFNAPQHTGNWTPEFSFIDPYGEARPNGGVLFVSDGPGLAPGEFYEMSMRYTNAEGDTIHDVFMFDQWIGDFALITLDAKQPLPFEELFDAYEAEDSIDDKNGWKGWDDDPAFDAPITDVQSHSASNSLQIDGDADVVRELELPEWEGSWSFSAWQYIPSDFQSGGGGQFRGSHFLLLNTYNDGGPYNWSVDLQAHSNTGMMKVYHGDDTNTINVPYATDRWVKIQVIIDLEDDWTQVYYDDELITEYTWTGGILGDGGGALDIASVDLYANGSSPIYYDDIVLEPIEDTSQPVLPIELDILNGNLLEGDVNSLHESDGNVVRTRSGFGETLIDLHNMEMVVKSQGPSPDGLTSLSLAIESRIDEPSGRAKISLYNWNANQFDTIDQYSIGEAFETVRYRDLPVELYVDNTGMVEMKVKHLVFVPFLAFTFESFVDRVGITVR